MTQGSENTGILVSEDSLWKSRSIYICKVAFSNRHNSDVPESNLTRRTPGRDRDLWGTRTKEGAVQDAFTAYLPRVFD